MHEHQSTIIFIILHKQFTYLVIMIFLCQYWMKYKFYHPPQDFYLKLNPSQMTTRLQYLSYLQYESIGQSMHSYQHKLLLW